MLACPACGEKAKIRNAGAANLLACGECGVADDLAAFLADAMSKMKAQAEPVGKRYRG